jgi:hypothetical protein
MRLLIAYDGSESADSALDDLTHAGLPADGEALVMTVAEVWLPPPPPSACEIVEMAAGAKGALGLERNYMATSQAGGKSSREIASQLSEVESESRSSLGLADVGTVFQSRRIQS